jgi:hypothetical protein
MIPTGLPRHGADPHHELGAACARREIGGIRRSVEIFHLDARATCHVLSFVRVSARPSPSTCRARPAHAEWTVAMTTTDTPKRRRSLSPRAARLHLVGAPARFGWILADFLPLGG